MAANKAFNTQLVAQRVATVYNGTTATSANTDILATDLSPERNVSAYRVTVALSVGSVFNVMCSDGTTAGSHAWGLNESTALQAGDLYTFVFGVSGNTDGSSRINPTTGETRLTYNFQVETQSAVEILLVDEIIGPVL